MSAVLPISPAIGEQGPEDTDSPAPMRAVPEQVRVAIHVGTYTVETSLSVHTPLSVVMEGLPQLLAKSLREEGLQVDFTATGVYTLAPEGGMPFARSRTLGELGVLDGDRLLLREVHSTEVFKPTIEDHSDALAEFNDARFSAFTPATAKTLGLTMMVAGAALAAVLLVISWWTHPLFGWWSPPAGALTLLGIVAAVIAGRRGARAVSYAAGLSAVPVAFALGWVSVPAYGGQAGQWTAANVFAANFSAAVVALLVLWLTGIGITVHTALVTTAGVVAAAAAVRTFTEFDLHQVGLGVMLVGLVLVSTAPALALYLAGVRPPSLPVPGEDVNRDELNEAAMVVEVFDDGGDMNTVALPDADDTQLERRSRVANKYLTGVFAAAAALIPPAATISIQPRTHYYWGEVAVAILTILVLVLRARTLTDRVHAVTFFLSAFALLVGFTVVVIAAATTASALAIALAVAAVAITSALAGVLLPGAKMSPIAKKRIEILEFLFITAIAPLAFWIVGAYAFFRDLL